MSEKLKNDFINPSAEFSPIPFWFWNAELSEEEITKQIQEFYDKGIRGFVIHPRKGLPKSIPYLSDIYMKYVKYAVEEAVKLNMKVVLYDEAMYPSGSAHGMVVKKNPKFAAKALKMVEYDESNPYTFLEDEKLVAVVSVEKNEQGEVLKDSLKEIPFEKNKFSEKEVSGNLFLEDVFFENIFSLSEKSADSAIYLFIETYSKGTIRGVHMGEDDGEPDAPKAADLLNPQAMQEFIHITYDAYYDALKDYFGTTIMAMFTDEPDVLGRRHIKNVHPWTGEFAEIWKAEGGKMEQLPLLWLAADDGSEAAVRINYQKTVNKRLSQTYYKQISDWCVAHGVALTGHPAKSDEIGLLNYFQIPGQDLVWRWIAPEDNKGIEGFNSTMGKCSSDSARHSGKRRNSNECFGCCGPNKIDWAFTADDMKWYLDWLFVRGVNLLYPHAFFYSIEGEERFGERPPDVGPNNTFWRYYERFATYMKRMCWLMTDSYNTTPIAILCKADYLPWESAKVLFQNQLEFNYLEENLLTQNACVIEDGFIWVQKQNYRILIVQSDDIDKSVVEKLNEFSNTGGQVIYWNKEENPVSAIWDILSKDDACEKTAYFHKAVDETEFDLAKDMRITHVVKENHDFYLIVNEGEERFEGSLKLPMNIAALKKEETVESAINSDAEWIVLEEWDAWRGTQTEVPFTYNESQIEVNIQLDRRESRILFVSRVSEDVNTVDAVSVDETNADRMSVDKANVDRTSVDEVNADSLNVDKANANKTNVDEVSAGTLSMRYVIPLSCAVKTKESERIQSIVTDLSEALWKISTKYEETVYKSLIYTEPALELNFETTELIDWTKWNGMSDFTGTVCYNADFNCNINDGAKYILDLGEVHEIASVSLNGQYIDTCMWAPYRFDITNAMLEGENHLHIEVMNTPANKLAKAALPSGLIGPVKMTERKGYQL